MAHAFDPSTPETEAGRSPSSRLAWSVELIPGQPGLSTKRNPISKREKQQQQQNDLRSIYTHNTVLFKHEEQAHVVCGKRDRTGDAVLSGTGLRETQIRTTTSSLRGSSARIKVDSCPCWRKEFQYESSWSTWRLKTFLTQISAQRLIGRYLGGMGEQSPRRATLVPLRCEHPKGEALLSPQDDLL